MIGAETAPAPASVVALGAARCGAVAWRVKGQLRLTVVVKAAFDMVPGGPMTPAAPEDIVGAEVHHRNVPTQSVRLTSDLAPFLPAADAVLTGHAHAPEGAPAQAITVRFAVFRERALVEKLIHVYGDRKGSGGEVAPFDQMPLVYERAFGGLGNRDNPFGTGAGAADKPPNLVDPSDPKKPACFAPVSASWPSRKRLLERAQQEGLKQPVAEIVGELPFPYFHAAPADQRIPQYLRGNEWVVLDGMHPTQRSVQSRLPDAAGAARVYGLGQGDGGWQDVPLVLDTLRVDADRMVSSLVWRGHVDVPDEATLATLAVVGGVALGDQAIEWPARLEEDVLIEYDSLSDAPPAPDHDGGSAGDHEGGAALGHDGGAALGHDGGAALGHDGGAAPKPPPPPPRLADARAALRASFEGTATATPEEERAAAGRRPLPFGEKTAPIPGDARERPPSPPAPPRPAPHKPPTGTMDSTMSLSGESSKARTLPFSKSGGALTVSALPAHLRPEKSPRPAPPRDVHGSTLNITPEDLLDRPAVPFVPPNAPAPQELAPPPPRPSPFAMGLQPGPPLEEPAGPAPTFLKKAPRTLLGVAPAPAVTAPAAPRRKAARTALGIELFPDGPLAIEVVPWGLTPARDVLTVIAKATCDLAPSGPAVPRPAADPPAGEAQAGPPPRCVYPSDLVPYKVRADVVLVGHAFAPGGSATEMTVAFRFGSADNGFAREVRVFGDRRWHKAKIAMEPSAPEPFARMPLAFDRAFGGPGFGPNPAGIGHHDPMRRGEVPLPNLEDPGQVLRSPRQSPPPAVFAPIPLAWKDRWAEAHESGLCLADALDWARFQAAPQAQQLAFLRGDEPYAIAGLSARHPSIEGALPGFRARAFATWKGEPGRFDEVTLRLDTVVIDVDALRVDLVWRGALPVADELAPEVEGLYLLADKLGAETPFAEARVKVLRP